MNEARAKAQELVETAENLLKYTEIPSKRSFMFYTDGTSETVESFCNKMKIVRKLCLKAMKTIREGDIVEKE